VTEAPEPGGGELDNAKAVKRGDVVVEPPAQALVELLGSVDVGDGDDLDLEVHVDLPDGRVAAGVVYFGGAHGCLLGCVVCKTLSFRRETSMGLRIGDATKADLRAFPSHPVRSLV
jgi:hypothetical protein